MKRNLLLPALALLISSTVCSMADDEKIQRIKELDQKIAVLKSEKARILAKTSTPVPEDADRIPVPPGQLSPHVSKAVLLIEGDKSSGTGFVGSTGGKKYLYTVAAVLSGNSKLTIRNSAGATLKNFGTFEAAENADVVRMEILEEAGDSLEFYPAQPPLQINQKIAVLGAPEGNAPVTVEHGLLLGTSAETLEVNVGNTNGGPVIDIATGKVVGLATRTSQVREDVWSEGTRQGQTRRFACRLDKERVWKTMKIGKFLADGKAVEGYLTETFICRVVGHELKSGLATGRVNFISDKMWEDTPAEKNQDHPLMVARKQLKEELSGNKGTASTAETQKKLQSLLGVAASRAIRSKDALKSEDYAWFHRVRAEEAVKSREMCIKFLN